LGLNPKTFYSLSIIQPLDIQNSGLKTILTRQISSQIQFSDKSYISCHSSIYKEGLKAENNGKSG